jgi:hypothetical protein
MKSVLRATSPEDFEQLGSLLRAAFHAEPDDPLLERAHMDWKYWRERPDWNGSRSYVLEREHRFVAHGCAWPVELRSPTGPLRALHLIDWAADPSAPGAGALLTDRLLTLADCIISVGGSETTTRILPKLGFKPAGEFSTFARPLHPWRQFVSHQHKNGKLPVRLVRNATWRLSGGRIPSDWHSRAAAPEQIPADGRSPLRSGVHVPARSASLYRYLLTCTTARFRIYAVHRDDELEGHFCLSFVPGQARVAEVRMKNADPAAWAVAYALACREASSMGAAEIVASSSSQIGCEALISAGYRLREAVPIMCRAAAGVAPRAMEVEMIDGDAFFLHRRRPEYLT